MRAGLAIIVMLVAVSLVWAQNPVQGQAQGQAMTYPRKPPKEWTAMFKDMQKRGEKVRARQAKADKQNKNDIAMAEYENKLLQAQLPQGAGYDASLDLWMPPAPQPPAPTKSDPEVKPKNVDPGAVKEPVN